MIVFDLDGTLVELDVPIDEVRAQLAAFFSERGFDEPMRPLLAAIERGAMMTTKSGDEAREVFAEAMAVVDAAEVEAARTARFRPGVAALSRLEGPLALLTNNGAACADVCVGRLAAAPFEFVGSRDDARAKPDPEGLSRLWELAGNPSAITMVGDSLADVQAARAFAAATDCSISIIGVRGGRNSERDLLAAGADRVCDDVGEFARGYPFR